MQAFLAFLNGFLYTATLFLLCLVLVVGTKSVLVLIKSKLSKHEEVPKEKPSPNPKPQKSAPKSTKPVRSIEINTDDVDRIYFKKSG
ncbi:MAG: hypothetical protein IJD54_01200 [Clostridia bacterium]|nr:hypothetical protein [Clostridia bacterium]